MNHARYLAMLAAIWLSAVAGPVTAQDAPHGDATNPGDVLIDGRPVRSAVRSFVASVPHPAPNRGPARWEVRNLCVGVVNLQTDAAQALVDRISQVGGDLGLQVGAPGCKPNLVVMATGDGAALATRLVQTRRAGFMLRTSGATAGEDALRAFQTSDRPVRWWHVSLPVNEDTGLAAVRLPRQPPLSAGPITRPSDVGADGQIVMGSRLHNEVSDQLQQVLVIVDVSRLGGARFDQLADYVALVGLAQIDPEADTTGFDTILNLFAEGAAAPPGLTPFDRAYLHGLYGAEGNTISIPGRSAQVAAEMERALRAEPWSLTTARSVRGTVAAPEAPGRTRRDWSGAPGRRSKSGRGRERR